MNKKGQFNLDRGFGVEIEFLTPSNISKRIIAGVLTRAGVETHVESYNHQTRPHWKIVTDSSVHSSQRGYNGDNEIVSPILYGIDGLTQLEKILAGLNSLNCIINRTCGIHVHHDVTEIVSQKESGQRFLINLVKMVAKFEHIIYKLVPPSRLDNRQYSIPVRKTFFSDGFKEFIRVMKLDCKEKYNNNNASYPCAQRYRASGLNLRNVWTRGAVEFRYHNGSLNFDKISTWIILTQAIVNTVENAKSVKMNNPSANGDGLFYFKKALGLIGDKDRCNLTKHACKHTTKRFKQLSQRENEYNNNSDYSYVQPNGNFLQPDGDLSVGTRFNNIRN